MSLVREILNTETKIEDWSEIEMKLSVNLENKKSKDDIVEYLRYLAWKKIDYKITPAQFENTTNLFKYISYFLHEKKDYLTLGYFVYYTQYFYTKKGEETQEVTKAPEPETEKEEKPVEETKEVEEEETPFGEDEDEESPFNDVEDDDEENDKENEAEAEAEVVESEKKTEEVKVKTELKYVMMADLYYTYAFAKDKEFWTLMLSQIYNVLLRILTFFFRIAGQDYQRNQVIKFSRTFL